jgi:ribosomal RNA-processing protein 8
MSPGEVRNRKDIFKKRKNRANEEPKSDGKRQMRDFKVKDKGSSWAKQKGGKSTVLAQMKQKLEGSRFRWLNELLYTSSGSEAFEIIKRQPELYQEYHTGYRHQTESWPTRPIDEAINWLKRKPKKWLVADLGCGDAELSSSVVQEVRSFDLVAAVPGIIACNISEVPMASSTIDVAIFCLSLMGKDYGSFVMEASRLLKPGGWLWIAEVQSRFKTKDKGILDDFIHCVKQIGFDLRQNEKKGSHFLVLIFQKRENSMKNRTFESSPWPALKVCQYKKR